MIRIGAITLDTSHPLAFAKILENDSRAKYVGVYDDSFRSNEEIENFIKRFGLEKRCDTLDELADMCDIGFVHSCNWDRHIDYALPFIQKGKPVFIDKPIVGNIRDCQKIAELVEEGAVILGSSSVRYCQEIVHFLDKPIQERGEVMCVYGTSGVDEFNYGIHVVEGICALADRKAQSVRFIDRAVRNDMMCDAYSVNFGEGLHALYHTFTGCWQPFAYTIMTNRSTDQFTVDSGKLYAALLNEIIHYLEGKQNRIAPIERLLDSIRIMLAGRLSRMQQGMLVSIDDIPPDDPGFDGFSFYKKYASDAKPLYTRLT
ncbi:MAG: Gfo/Idh/MocA family oxidoreductase [Clostridia bacterium]|nr:Gfo/Idh/MocA family oxidoreductase [Clostridia bacterium]